MSIRWQKTIIKWSLSSSPESLLVVRYEDLKRDILKQVTRMLDFLHQDYDMTELPQIGFDEFKRNRGKVDFEHYIPEQKADINRMVLQTIEILKEKKLDHLFEIREYLST